MDKYVYSALTSAGLEVDGNTACGVLNDIFVTVDEYDYRYAFVNFTFHTMPDTVDLIRKIMDAISVKDYSLRITTYGVSIKIKGIVGGLFAPQKGPGDYLSDLDRTVRLVPERLAKNGIKGEGYCAVCGGQLDENSKKYVRLPDMFTVSYHSGCEQTLLDDIKQDNTKEGKKAFTGSYGRTVVMALVGVVIQFLLSWLFMAQSPVPYWADSWLAAVATLVLSIFFGGKMDKKHFLITSLIVMIGAMAGFPILELLVFKGINSAPLQILLNEAVTFATNALFLGLCFFRRKKL